MEIDKLVTGNYTLIDESYQTGLGQVCIQIPNITTGSYKISLYKENNTDELLFSFYVQKIGDTMNITYGRINESIIEFRVAKNGELHIITKYGKRLYYYAETTLDTDIFPKTSGTYPYDDSDYEYEYLCGKDHANIYTSWNGVDILGTGTTEKIGNCALATYASDKYNTSTTVISYDPYSGDKTLRIYRPDQPLNTDSDVKFNTVSLPLEGLYLKTDSTGKVIGVDLDLQYVLRSDWTTKNTKLENSISTVNNTVNAVNESLNTQISTEQTARSNADASLQSQIDSLSKALSDYKTSNDAALKSVSDRVTANETAISNEETARSNADTNLNTSIGNVSDALSTYKTDNDKAVKAVSNKATTNATNISNEITNRTNADTTLQTNIDTVSSALSTYKTSNDTAVSGLSTRLDTAESDIDDLDENKQDNLTFSTPLKNTDNTVTLDGSDIVHKSGTETITGKKTATGGFVFSGVAPVIPTSTPSNSKVNGAIWKA